MITDINKFSLNWILSIIAPGSIIILFILWGIGIYFPSFTALFGKYEAFSIFLFLVVAFIAGLINDSISQQVEYSIYKKEGRHPRLKILEKNAHWLEDLDIYYFKYLGIHLYDWDKDNKAKEGAFNGKKVSNFNLSQFEQFANFILSGQSGYSQLETAKSKYLLCRNLSFSFLLSAAVGVFYIIGHGEFKFVKITGENIFYNSYFCTGICILLLILCFYLSYIYKKFRLHYLTQLYRYIRYYYLITIK